MKEVQLHNEWRYSRKHIDRYIKEEIEQDPEVLAKLEKGISLLTDWLVKDYYESKEKRLGQVMLLNLADLVMGCFVGISYCQTPELFTSVTAQLAGRLGFSDKEDGIKTMAEIIAVLANCDAFDLTKADPQASFMVQSRIPLSQKLTKYIVESSYLPPMVCEPMTISANHHSGYLTHNESVILKSNHHNDPLALDCLNIQNKVALTLDTEFLSTVEETPSTPLDSVDKMKGWNRFKQDSYAMYIRLTQQARKIYLTHKYDKRGRMYAEGYHITTQGSPFKKAMLEFADVEVVKGVPCP